MEEQYIQFLIKNKVYFEDSGICGVLESFSSSTFSKTDCVFCISPLDKTTSEILEMINKVAITAVDLVKKFPTDLVEAKLSWDKPRPSAPPSDLCNKISRIKITAKTTFVAIRIVSI
tara:strand:+ start:1107 stop:1457 length:351 start_codon:yes stop_codon:yes gene_type:complete